MAADNQSRRTLLGSVQCDHTSEEGEGDEGQPCKCDGKLLCVGHFVSVRLEEVLRLVITSESLGLIISPEKAIDSGGRTLLTGHLANRRCGGGKGTNRDRQDGDEESRGENGLAHRI